MRKQALIFGYRSPLFFPEADGTYLHYDSYRQYFGDTTEAVLGLDFIPIVCQETTHRRKIRISAHVFAPYCAT